MKKRFWNMLCYFAAVVSAGLLVGCQTTTPLTWKVPDGAKTVEVNGYPTAYSELGSGPTVVLVHGVMCDYRCWGGTQRALAGEYRVISVSMRHFYPQDWDGSGNTFTVVQHAKDLAAFIEKMNPPVRLVGHSYGGLVASEVARTRPELVAKLVLAEAATDGLLAPPTKDQLALRKKFGDQTENMLRTKGADAGLEFAVDTLNGKGAWSRYPAQVQSFHRDNAWTMVATTRDDSPRGTCAGIGSLKMPVLLVTGEKTSARYKQIVPAQAKCLPGAKTVVVPGVGHAMMMNPAVFDPALKDFLR
jgi:pimeloyl-ACP methyl ester carboxylesterase